MLYTFEGQKPSIGKDTYVSELATVIGNIAEGSLVKWGQKIPARMVAAGNPAAMKREVSAKDEEIWAFGKQLYIDLAKRYLKSGLHPVDLRECLNESARDTMMNKDGEKK